MIEVFSYQLNTPDLVFLLLSAALVGSAKAGISGANLMAVPLLAIAFGSFDSTGVMLPMLITADIFAVAYYRQHADWFHLTRIFPWAALGVLLGTLFGDLVNEDLFRQVMGGIIFASLALMVWRETSKTGFHPPRGLWIVILLGIGAGFTTMVGNLGGAFTSLYLLTMLLPKNVYIGTAAWFFLCINLFKTPFHIFVWDTIDWNSLGVSLLVAPAVIAGFFIGMWLVKKMPELFFRWVVIVSTALASVIMMVS